jgi:hypothetical protein
MKGRAMKSNIICSVFHPITRFDWKFAEGFADISDLGSGPFCQVYNDACDEGFGVIGRNREVIFAKSKTVRDAEQEIEMVEFESISEPGFKITLFND